MLFFAPIRWIYRLVSLTLTGIIVYVIVSAVQVVEASNVPSTPKVAPPSPAAIAVLVPSSKDPTLSSDTTNRLQEALTLYDGRDAKRITVIQTGTPGVADSSSTTSTAADQTLTSSVQFFSSQGVPRRAIRKIASTSVDSGLVDLSRSLSSSYHVLLVTDGINALWLTHAAAAAHLHASVVRPSGSNKLFIFELGPLWRQATGVAVARVIGYSHTTWVNG